MLIASLLLLILAALVGGFFHVRQKATRLPQNNPQWYLETAQDTREGPVVVLAGDSITHGGVSANIGVANGFVLHSDLLHLNETSAAMIADLIEDFVTERLQ